MNTFKHPDSAGDAPFSTIPDMDAGLSAMEAKLAAVGVENSGKVSDSKHDALLAVMILMDDKDDDVDSLMDELDMFRRENDFNLD